MFDKKGTGHIARESLGDLLRALGQNPTQAEVSEIAASAPKDSELLACDSPVRLLNSNMLPSKVDFQSFLNILHRPNGFKPAGTPGASNAATIINLKD